MPKPDDPAVIVVPLTEAELLQWRETSQKVDAILSAAEAVSASVDARQARFESEYARHQAVLDDQAKAIRVGKQRVEELEAKGAALEQEHGTFLARVDRALAEEARLREKYAATVPA